MERSAHASAASENGGKRALPGRLGAADGALPDGRQGSSLPRPVPMRSARCKMIPWVIRLHRSSDLQMQLARPLRGRSRKKRKKHPAPDDDFHAVCASGRVENALETHGDGAQRKASRSGGRRADAAGDEKPERFRLPEFGRKKAFRQGARQRHAPFHAVCRV